jgi:hypothetical protein
VRSSERAVCMLVYKCRGGTDFSLVPCQREARAAPRPTTRLASWVQPPHDSHLQYHSTSTHHPPLDHCACECCFANLLFYNILNLFVLEDFAPSLALSGSSHFASHLRRPSTFGHHIPHLTPYFTTSLLTLWHIDMVLLATL